MSKILFVVISIVIFYIAFIAFSDFENFSRSISQFEIIFLIPVLLLLFFSIVFKGIRLHLICKERQIPISFKNSILLYMSGLSMVISPAGSGELIKSYYLKKKYNYELSKSFPIVVTEKYFDFLSIIILVTFSLSFNLVWEIAIVVIFTIILMIFIFLMLTSKSFFKIFSIIINKIPKINKKFSNLGETRKIFQSLLTKKMFAKCVLLSITAFGLESLAIYSAYLGFNLDLGFIFTTFVTYSSVLFGTLSFLPAGIGVTEISIVGFLTREGISLSLATSIMVLTRLTGMWFVTLIGFITTKLFLKTQFK